MRDGKREEHERKSNQAAITEFLAACSVVITLVFEVLNLQFGIVNIVVYAVMIILLLYIWVRGVYLVVTKTAVFNQKNKDHIAKVQRKYKEDKGTLAYILMESDKKVEQLRKVRRQRGILLTIIMWGGIICGVLFLCGQVKSMMVPTTTGGISSVPQTSGNNDNSETGTVTLEDEVSPEQEKEMENKKFILDEPDRLMVLSNEDEAQILYISESSTDSINTQVAEHMQAIYEIDRKDTLANASTVDETIIDDATAYDTIFDNDMNKALELKEEHNYEGWLCTIPHSNYLEENVIKQRELLWEPEKGETIFNSDTCFLLANDYQLLADEYMRQSGKPETVIYYYAKSIIWTERGLSYGDISARNKSTYYNYLKTRYKDIADYIEKNDKAFGESEEHFTMLRKMAFEIYTAM